MKKNIIVLGIGRFGQTLSTKLFEKGMYVTAVDKDINKVEKVANNVSSAVQADIAEEVAMKSLGINNYDIAIISTGTNLESSIQATLICKDEGIPEVIAKATSESHARILKKIGADYTIYPELDTAERLARSLSGTNLIENIQFSNDYSLIEIVAKKEWVGNTVGDLDFRNKYKMNMVGIMRDEEMIMDINHDTRINKNDVLILIGSNENANLIERKIWVKDLTYK